MHLRQCPVAGASGCMYAVVTISPRNTWEPMPGTISCPLMPVNPSPERTAQYRSRSGAVSTHTLDCDPQLLSICAASRPLRGSPARGRMMLSAAILPAGVVGECRVWRSIPPSVPRQVENVGRALRHGSGRDSPSCRDIHGLSMTCRGSVRPGRPLWHRPRLLRRTLCRRLRPAAYPCQTGSGSSS